MGAWVGIATEPIAVGYANVLGWFLYGVLARDLYLCLSCLGIVFSLYGILSALTLIGDIRETNVTEKIMLGGTLYWYHDSRTMSECPVYPL